MATDRDTWEQAQALFDLLVDQDLSSQVEAISALEDDRVSTLLKNMLAADRTQAGLIDRSAKHLAESMISEHSDAWKAPEQWIGQLLGAWTLLSELGRGGTSLVMLAERSDGHFEKRVAIKLIQTTRHSAVSREQLSAEASILGRLQHPDIAHVLDAGVGEDGITWMAMEYCDGVPLTQFCDQQQLSCRQRLALLQRIVLTVQYAHSQLIVHRDLKPSNILIQPNGHPKLLDFGIAGILQTADESLPASRMMTPDYAAPEQLLGQSSGVACDLYALGVITYELLTSLRPISVNGDPGAEAFKQLLEDKRAHRFESMDATIRNLQQIDPQRAQRIADARQCRSASRLADQLSGDPQFIVARAMHREPSERYRNAQALANDIERNLKQEPITARTPSRSYRLRLFLRRHRMRVTIAMGFVALLMGGLIAALWQAQIAREHASRAEAVTEFLTDLFKAADPWQNQQTPVTAGQLVAEAIASIDEELLDEPRTRADILLTLAIIEERLGSFKSSESLCRKAIETLSKLKVLDEQLAQTQLCLFYALIGQDRYQDAAEASAAAMSLTPVEDSVDELTLRARYAHAASLNYVFELAQSAALINETLSYASQIETLPVGSEILGLNLDLLSRVQNSQGNQQQALDTNLLAEPLLIKAFGSVHSAVADTWSARASIHYDMGNIEQALALDSKALAVFRSIYGEIHERTLLSKNNRSTALLKLGRYPEALTTLEEILPDQIALYGTENNTVSATLSNIGSALFGLDRLKESTDAYDRSLAAGTADPEASQISIELTRGRLAQVLTASGALVRAETEFQQALGTLRTELGAEHPLVIRTEAYQAHFRWVAGDASGLSQAREVHRQLTEIYGVDSRYSAHAAMVLGLFEAQTEEIDTARARLHEAKSILSRPSDRVRYRRDLALIDQQLERLNDMDGI